ncbi:hypothetical protein QVD17_21135 [Tagetes erecta]|uniref:Uncharacterized protein n=1 Tax=Tagetes erecta TaxID=13708 RepID=A0AAD8NYM4_TARER|nr:hypothetical protein QVD17_21135 [Tagetes erecta]
MDFRVVLKTEATCGLDYFHNSAPAFLAAHELPIPVKTLIGPPEIKLSVWGFTPFLQLNTSQVTPYDVLNGDTFIAYTPADRFSRLPEALLYHVFEYTKYVERNQLGLAQCAKRELESELKVNKYPFRIKIFDDRFGRLSRSYIIRLRGIHAPVKEQMYGKEAKE